MGTVINLPRVRVREAPARTADVSTVVVILPVVRIERTRDASSCVEPRVADSMTECSTKPAPGRRRRKRVAPAPAAAFVRG
jgi:hypothetical protein